MFPSPLKKFNCDNKVYCSNHFQVYSPVVWSSSYPNWGVVIFNLHFPSDKWTSFHLLSHVYVFRKYSSPLQVYYFLLF